MDRNTIGDDAALNRRARRLAALSTETPILVGIPDQALEASAEIEDARLILGALGHDVGGEEIAYEYRARRLQSMLHQAKAGSIVHSGSDELTPELLRTLLASGSIVIARQRQVAQLEGRSIGFILMPLPEDS